MTLPGLPSLVDSGQLADTGSLAALKQAAAKNSPQALQAAAKQFESLFVSMVLKSMQQANFKDPLFGSDQGSLYQDMYDDQIAAQISKGKGLGLADMLVQQLRREGAGGPAASSSASKSAAGATPGATPASGRGAASIGTGRASALAPERPAKAASPATAAASAATGQAGCPTSIQQADFARALWPDAEHAARQLGVSPVTLLAQAALETNWGRSVPQGAGGATSNNLFGIKATAWSGPAVESSTREYSGGAASTVKAQFRAYGSTSQCFQDYVSLLSNDPRYAAALGTGNDVQAFGTALQQGGYATDPAYARKLTAVAGTLARALTPQPGGAAPQGPPAAAPGSPGPLKFAADLPTTSGSGTLQRR
jgi:flagellar protein FlgJ